MGLLSSSSSSSSPSSGLDLAARRDEQLAVERVCAGDALALEIIFTAYRGELLRSATRVTQSPALAEEVVQDVFLAIWAGRHGVTLTGGADNIFNVYPDKTKAANSSGGIFVYSGISPFGYDGAFYYGRVTVNF